MEYADYPQLGVGGGRNAEIIRFFLVEKIKKTAARERWEMSFSAAFGGVMERGIF